MRLRRQLPEANVHLLAALVQSDRPFVPVDINPGYSWAMAESLLVALVACLLSFSFGIMAGWCGSGISQYVSFFGGLHPELIIPWSSLALGLALTVLLCIAAALWPAIRIGRTETLRLLQAGRAMV